MHCILPSESRFVLVSPQAVLHTYVWCDDHNCDGLVYAHWSHSEQQQRSGLRKLIKYVCCCRPLDPSDECLHHVVINRLSILVQQLPVILQNLLWFPSVAFWAVAKPLCKVLSCRTLAQGGVPVICDSVNLKSCLPSAWISRREGSLKAEIHSLTDASAARIHENNRHCKAFLAVTIQLHQLSWASCKGHSTWVTAF